jgi:hypothetical protein
MAVALVICGVSGLALDAFALVEEADRRLLLALGLGAAPGVLAMALSFRR